LALIYLEMSFSPAVSSTFRAVPIFLGALAIGHVSDGVNTHYVRWITANLRLKKEAVQERRRLWNQRFYWWELSREIKAFRIEARRLEETGRSQKAAVLRKKIGDLRELRAYPLGFLLLVYLVVLFAVGAPTAVLLGSGILATTSLVFRRSIVSFR